MDLFVIILLIFSVIIILGLFCWSNAVANEEPIFEGIKKIFSTVGNTTIILIIVFIIATAIILGFHFLNKGIESGQKKGYVKWGNPTAAQEKKLTQGYTKSDSIARGMAEKYIKHNLKTPSVAKIHWTYQGDDAVYVDNGVWRFKGEVDSQNSFGAMIRNQFTCVMKEEPDGTWNGVAIEFH